MLLSRKSWQSEGLANIAPQVINEDIYNNHVAIRDSKDKVLNNAIEKMSCYQESENIIFIFNKLFGKYRVVLDDTLAHEYGDNYFVSSLTKTEFQ